MANWWRTNAGTNERVGRATIVIAWDPDVISEQEYAQITSALADMVRAEGGTGIQRVGTYLLSLPGVGAYVE